MITLSIQILSLAALYILLRPLINGAVYFPTSKQNIDIIKKMADPKLGDKVVDLGSGDGRIVIALAELGAEVTGYEINPILVFQSNLAIRKAGLRRQAHVYWKSFWRMDLAKFNTVVVYGFPPIMKRLEDKLERELKNKKEQTKVISNQYPFPGWTPTSTEKNVYLYIR